MRLKLTINDPCGFKTPVDIEVTIDQENFEKLLKVAPEDGPEFEVYEYTQLDLNEVKED